MGPFDFTAGAKVEGVYTTNVEQERPSETTADREDYYIVTSLSLNSRTTVTPNTELNLDTGAAIEEHFNRPDLNNSTEPFGRFRLSSATRMRYLTLMGDVFMERTSESQEGVYVPGGRKKRDVSDEAGYTVGLEWRRNTVFAEGSYGFRRERHQDEEFTDGDEDETTIGFSAGWQFSRRLALTYDYEQTKTELVNQLDGGGDGEDEWDDTQEVGLRLTVLERPLFTYTFGYEKDNEDPWETKHTFDLSDDFETRKLRLKVMASYSEEEEPEEDDISFTYGASLEHQLSQSARHGLSVTREPVETFGSTEDTDNTTVGYMFQKDDLFIYNLNLRFDVEYSRDKPTERTVNPEEKRLTYRTSLEYVRALTRRLERRLAYLYSYEDSNIEDEALLEHRVTLSFDYTF